MLYHTQIGAEFKFFFSKLAAARPGNEKAGPR